ncbi:sigma-70 family RNA polymerase sigma factor [Kaistia dalseonensis]|uniref:RNA polymerase sigma-70 factor (ECF subfamily) n=1 Tax=Kaistia dalseonensis TaxID=410840 RepID=A0ABU0HD09_9HYPH|nr:sigma-70 family RNA polymerase sigma factor [Kaistia dalseonensis]MCX5497569.1 sigma-70 family RNA polymerase sigma factor [Kaistia dalseonensis]MDQ0440209.1 RNA polymerase sigma-70 factor (ECF subfamily) [Kaistia dalseonensis]
MRYRLVVGGAVGTIVESSGEKGRAASLARMDDSGSEAAIRADQALMRAIADGEEDAFARLIRAEAPRLTRFVAAILSDISEAEEIVQETLLRLWKNAERWEPNARVGTYLHRIAYRLSIDRLRRRRPHVDIDDFDDLLEDDSLSPERRLVRIEDVRLVHEALDRLPDRQRAAIVLAHFQELPQAEAAAVMAIGEHAYESLLARARRRLRQLLAGQGEEDGEEGTGL